MHLIRRLPEALDRPTAVAIGNFDGLHRGHQAVITAMTRAADAYELMPTVLTFEPHPRRFFKPDVPDFRLERVRAKFARIAQEGVECAVVPRFNAAFASMPADVFMEEVLAHRLNAKAIAVGENFVFGHKRAGDIDLLKRWGSYHDIEIIAVPPVMVGDNVCSSSAVRTAIAVGDMPQAARLLGRAYMLSGRVVHGEARGRTMGFPTANLALPPGLLLPAYGVYAVYVGVGSANYSGVANFGVRPTIENDGRPTLEVHLFDMHEDLYGQPMRVFMVKQLRAEMKFESKEALIMQIAQDCLQARVALGGLE
jgi:riboflavin kinase/FMN adenylyltransferase